MTDLEPIVQQTCSSHGAYEGYFDILHLTVYTLKMECQTYSLADTSKAVNFRQTVSLALRKEV